VRYGHYLHVYDTGVGRTKFYSQLLSVLKFLQQVYFIIISVVCLMSNRYILTLTFDNEQKFPAVVISFLFDNLIQQVVFCLFWHTLYITCYNLKQYVFSCVLHVSDLNSSSLIDYKLCVG
jgi:hypothetical protein